jgi:PEP-CTERM motif
MPRLFSSATRALASLALLAACAAQAAPTTYSLRDYFDGLSDPYPVQQAGNLWTFHKGGSTAAYLPPYGDNYYDYGHVLYQQIGSKTSVGGFGCTPGFCPAIPAQSRATFDGVFVHSGSASATGAVFHIDGDVTLDEITLWSETVVNGNNGNGFDVQLRAIVGNQVHSLDSFVFNFAGTRNTRDERHYTPGLTLHAGDVVEILYGNNGGYLYDHGNVQAFISLSPANPGGGGQGVPEPSGLALAGLALAALVGARRQRGRSVQPDPA